LFIDEVGKFITQTNDYFYPPAAPIIYAFFLLSVLLYQRIRTRSSLDVRSQLYCVMDGMDEVLDHDLSDHERADLLQRLDTIIRQTPARDLAELARSLKEFIGHEQLHVIPHQPGTLERLQTRYKAWEARWLTRRRFQAILAGGVIAVAVWMMYYPMAIVLSINTPGVASPILTELIQKGLIRGYTALNWYEARVALEISVGVILLIGAGLLFGGKDKRGSALIYLGLLLSLTTVNLIVFYFDQFSTIFNATIQFIFLLIVIYYRNAFMIPKEQDI
jgi:hypothetical protein